MQHVPFLLSWPPMYLTSVSFAYVFLPLSLAFYYLMPHKHRPAALVMISLGYCFFAQSQCVLVIFLSVAIDFALVRLMKRWDGYEAGRRACVALSVIKNLAVILYFGAYYRLMTGAALLGTFICSVSALDAVFAIYRRQNPYENNFFYFMLYCVFFPRLYAGPVQPYKEFTQQLSQIHLHSRSLSMGLGQYVKGAFKYVFFGTSLVQMHTTIRGFGPKEQTVLSFWMLIISFAFAVYYVLGGYADMAQGLGMLYGVFLPRNYYYPFQSRNVEDFFERFNMTGTALLKRIVCEPLKSERESISGDILCLVLFGMLAGTWWGIRMNFLLWGSYLALFVIMERHLYSRLLRAMPRLLARIGTLCVVLSAFTILAGGSLDETGEYLKGMLSFGRLPLTNDRILYLITSNWMVLVLSALLCTNMISLLVTWMHSNFPRATNAVLGAVHLGILVILTSALV